MRSPEQLRLDAEALVAKARADARRGHVQTHDAPVSARPAEAARVVDEVDRGLAELRSRGYRELADGSWVNPLGQIIRRACG